MIVLPKTVINPDDRNPGISRTWGVRPARHEPTGHRHPAAISTLCSKAGLRTCERHVEQSNLLSAPDAPPSHGRTAHSGCFDAHPLAYRCGGSTGIAAAFRSRTRPRTCFPFHPPAGIDRRTPCCNRRIEIRRSGLYPIVLPLPASSHKVMKNIHKHLLLLDAKEKLPL